MSDISLSQKEQDKKRLIETVESVPFTPFEVEFGKLENYNGSRYDSRKLNEEKNLLALADQELLDLTQVTKQRAKVQGGRVNAQLILNSQKRSKDNKEMREVKESIVALETLLSKPFDEDLFEGDEYVTSVENAYQTVIDKCQIYIDNKNPYFAKGIERKNLVTEHRDIMKNELQAFRSGVAFIREKKIVPYLRSSYDILCESRLQEIAGQEDKDLRISVQHFNDTAVDGVVNTREFNNVCYTLKVLNMFLREPFPVEEGNTLVKTDEFSHLDVITMKQNRLLEDIDLCLESKDGCAGNEQLKHQLETLKEQIQQDQKFMQTRSENFRLYLKTHPKEAAHATYNDALGFTRSVVMDLSDTTKYETEKLGDSLSVVFKIKDKATKKTYFFQEEQSKSYSSNYARDFSLRFPELVKDPELQKNCQDILQKYLDLCNASGDLDVAHGLMKDHIQSCRYDSKELAEYVCKKINVSTDLIAQHLEFVGNMLKEYPTFLAQQAVSGRAGISEGNTITGRNVATSRLARLLGFDRCICESRSAIIKRKGVEIKGNLMDETAGEDLGTVVKRNRLKYLDSAVSDLMDLRVFDFICGQIDRHAGNYHVDHYQGEIRGIKGIDNDMCFGEHKLEDFKTKTHSRHQTKYDPMILDSLSDSFIKYLDSLNQSMVYVMLSDLLTKPELDALWDRIRSIQQDLRARGDLVKNAKSEDENLARKERAQYLRQYKAIKAMKQTQAPDNLFPERLLDSKLFTINYLDVKIDKLQGKRKK